MNLDLYRILNMPKIKNASIWTRRKLCTCKMVPKLNIAKFLFWVATCYFMVFEYSQICIVTMP